MLSAIDMMEAESQGTTKEGTDKHTYAVIGAPGFACAFCTLSREHRNLRGQKNHMIAVGGAGSSGLPAFAKGTRIITNAMITRTMNPEYVAGSAKITGKGLLKK